MAISRYHFTHCTALLEIVPGDCHGPKGPRNDTVVVTQLRNRYCAKQQFNLHQIFVSGKYSSAKSTLSTRKDFPFRYSNSSASVVKQKVSL